ncbi:hypothetical protein [Legionella quinlivanii]|uniref:hypothetical protein n=1 Tax=Legionella quinlivanii TaxID=45073 RepID=UPI00224436C2|nr:hypothetical protein [Legionella quinlivanii]MCW8450787.1 hypothetical protein [Legionella quinlivanii]
MNLTEEDALKLQRQLAQLLEDFIEQMRKANKDLNRNMVGASPFEAIARTESANDAAYQGYLAVQKQNNAKSDEAFDAYRETCERNNANSAAAFDSYRAGEMTYEEAVAIKEKNDLANDKAYDFACSLKHQNDKASDKAYEAYLNAFDANTKTCDQFLQNQNNCSLSDTVSSNLANNLELTPESTVDAEEQEAAEFNEEEAPEENASSTLR